MIKLLRNSYWKYKKKHSGNNFLLFAVNFGVGVLFLYLTNRYLLTYAVFEKDLGEKLDSDQLNLVFLRKDKIVLYSYLCLGVYLRGKYAIVAVIVQVVSTYRGINLSFSAILGAVMTANLVFLFERTLTFLHFLNSSNFGTDQLGTYVPFSLSSLFESTVKGPWQYALQTISIWELLYCILLAEGLSRISGQPFYKSAGIVVAGYLPAFFGWIAIVTFITFLIVQ